LQKADPDVAIIREWLEAGVEPTRDRVMPCSNEVKAYVSQWKSLIVDDGVVYRKFKDPHEAFCSTSCLYPNRCVRSFWS